MGSVRYELEASIERAGAFKSNLSGKTEVVLVRNPAEQNLETHEPISITRTWEDQLHYEILISGKAFPLNGNIPIAFKFTPLAKVRLHRIKVFLTENVEYFCRDKKVHRLEPIRKLMLFERQAQKPTQEEENDFPSSSTATFSRESTIFSSGVGVSGSRPLPVSSGPHPRRGPSSLPRFGKAPTKPQSSKDDSSTHSLLGNLEAGDGSGAATEFEIDVPLPGCGSVRTQLETKIRPAPMVPVRFHHTTIWSHIVVHHWIKIVLRISKVDENSENKAKRRHFEISIDSPIHLLSVTPLSE
jgi:arrestin-related trafficking adapter 3/6